MTFATYLTTFLAIYAALLATLLGYLQLTREQRKISILLQLDQIAQDYCVIITNIGYRPITLTGMLVILAYGRSVTQKMLRSEVDRPPFPVTLTDGQHIRIALPASVTKQINADDENMCITVYDAEGREYTKYRKLSYNEKYDIYAAQ